MMKRIDFLRLVAAGVPIFKTRSLSMNKLMDGGIPRREYRNGEMLSIVGFSAHSEEAALAIWA